MASHTPTILAFDWGDTLMQLFPEYRGAMVDWPQVAAVDGAAEALRQLQGSCRLFVATNAVDSSAAQIQAALARVGLDGFFERVFTMHELGARKPSAAFFANLSRQIGEDPADCIMIGDDYKADTLGPLQAGWRSVWYNPGNRASPGLLPLHGADIDQLTDLPEAVAHLDLPRVETCLSWIQQHGTGLNLIQHQLSVAGVAYRMALWMRANGTRLDPVLAQRGGLLHDIGKIMPKKQGERLNHGEAGARALEALGEPVLAEITRRHLLSRLIDPDHAPSTWEQKLVYFADKLVERSWLVPVQERMRLLRERYPQAPDTMDDILPHLLALQADLCRRAGVPVEELVPRLEAAFFEN